MGFATTSSVNCQDKYLDLQVLGTDSELTMFASGIYLYDNTTPSLQGIFKITSVSGGAKTNYTSNTNTVFINTGTLGTLSTTNIGISRSVIVGGTGITAKTSNAAYANKLALNASGSSYETIVSTATLTADRTATLPDASGVIGLVRYVAVNTPTVHTATTGEVVAVTTGGAALVVNLPSAATANQVITVKKVDNGAGAVSLTPAGAETIDGTAGVYAGLANQWESVTLVSNGVSNWLITAII
jgi:enamine deaminase RidA (YjgF/YER057c/UK114 family)